MIKILTFYLSNVKHSIFFSSFYELVPFFLMTFLTLAGPCRPLCQRVKRACLQILQNFNLPWPEALNCDRFNKNKQNVRMTKARMSKDILTINPLVVGFLQSTIMSTCAWMATTLPLRPGQGKTQFFVKIVGLLSQSLVTQFATD